MLNLKQALICWSELLGSDNVIVRSSDLGVFETTTFQSHQKVAAVIKPSTTEQVQESLKIANRFQVSIYPISAGKNWGFGSCVPVNDGNVIMDLRLMNKIVEYDETLGYVVVEPGVSFQQLYSFLESQKSSLMINVPGASPYASVIGNVLERGHGAGVYADRFSHTCAMEVVLPDGTCIHTGFGLFSDAKSKNLHRWGVGPYIDGIFTQSNFGVVTRLTIWLSPKPNYFQICHFGVDNFNNFYEVINRLQILFLNGVIKSSITIWNDIKAISTFQRYPWEDMKFITPISEDVRQKIRHDRNINAWNGWIGIYSPSLDHGYADRKIILETLKNQVEKLIVVDGDSIHSCFGAFRLEAEKIMDFSKSIFMGVPSENTVKSVYWRKKQEPTDEADLDRDRCGKITCAITIPFRGEDVKASTSIIEEIVCNYGFEANISLICISPRCIDIASFLLFDRDVIDDEKRAFICHQEVINKLIDSGYFPYRLDINSMNLIAKNSDEYKDFITKIGKALDPKRILAPGRYDFNNLHEI